MSLYTEILADNPEGFWQLDETAGTTAADSSGNGHTATYIGTPTLDQASLNVTDLTDNSVLFNGSSQYIDCGTDAGYALSGDFSAVVTFQGGTPAAAGVLISRFDDGVGQGFSVRQEMSGGISFYYKSSAGFVSITSLAYTSGNHIAHILHDSSGIYLYIDGILAAADTSVNAQANITTNTQNLFIAAQDYIANRNYSGAIGLAAIFNSALSDARITAQVSKFFWTVDGSLAETLGADKFTAFVINVETGSLITSQSVVSGAFYIFLADQTPVFITIVPTQARWVANNPYALDDVVFSTDPAAEPYLQKCTSAGTSGANEPVWNTTVSGSTPDNTITWTNIMAMEQPITHGPLIPS